MAKRALVSSSETSIDTTNAKLIVVNDLIDQLSFAVADLLGNFDKATSGKSPAGDTRLEFIKAAHQGTIDFPEILAQSFNKSDFSDKLTAALTYYVLRNSINKAIDDKWADNLSVCNTDAFNYANEFYGIIQREAAKNVKYAPYFAKLKAYYKRTKADDNKESGTTKPPTA
jgi:hypothetical protein